MWNELRIISRVLLAFTIINRFAPITHAIEDDEIEIFEERALNFWVTKLFAQSFQEMTLPSNEDAVKGSRLYNERKEPNFEGDGNAGMLLKVPMHHLKETLNMWQSDALIPNEAADSMRNILENLSFKTIVDYVHVREDGQIVYAVIGLIEMRTSDGNRSESVLYSFTTYKLRGNTVITSDNTDETRCIMWRQLCPTMFRVNGFSDSESESLFSHIRLTAIKVFVEESRPFSLYLNKESMRYERFLPESFQYKLRTLRDHPDKLPTEVFVEDPFNIEIF